MAVLQVLMAHAGEVVSRQTLMETVWAGRVVGEEVLTRCISELRSALGDKAGDPEIHPDRSQERLPAAGVEPSRTRGAPVYRRRVVALAAGSGARA